jgi:hypothetical protein
MFIVDVEAGQTPLEMVHSKILSPATRMETGEIGESEFVVIPEPDNKLQIPVPTVGVLAAMIVFGLVMQRY